MIEDKLKTNIELAPYTTFQIGGKAKFFIEISQDEELEEICRWARKAGEKVVFLGGGSNILVSDKGFNGVVIRLVNNSIDICENKIECGAGALLLQVAHSSVGRCLSGLEWSFGIPRATIGGTIRGNAGAFGKAIGDIVESVKAFNFETGEFKTFSKNDCQFKYRGSFFKDNPQYLLWSAVLKFESKSKEEINETVEKNISARFKTQPKLPSAGCVFKNILVDDLKEINHSLFDFISREIEIKGDKIGAGYLVDLAGLKGKTIGGAKISLEHGSFVVNTAKASAADVKQLIELVKKSIKDRFGLTLEEEVQYVGFDD